MLAIKVEVSLGSNQPVRIVFTAPYQCGLLYQVLITQVNRMSRSRRVLAIGGKQRNFGLGMVCIETILFHLDSL